MRLDSSEKTSYGCIRLVHGLTRAARSCCGLNGVWLTRLIMYLTARAKSSQRSEAGSLDRVSTGSGSDLVSDQHAIFLTILDPRLTRALPLPVLTRSKSDAYFQDQRAGVGGGAFR